MSMMTDLVLKALIKQYKLYGKVEDSYIETLAHMYRTPFYKVVALDKQARKETGHVDYREKNISRKEKEMKKTIEIQEEVFINQKGEKVILEKGDKIEILKEASQGSPIYFGFDMVQDWGDIQLGYFTVRQNVIFDRFVDKELANSVSPAFVRKVGNLTEILFEQMEYKKAMNFFNNLFLDTKFVVMVGQISFDGRYTHTLISIQD